VDKKSKKNIKREYQSKPKVSKEEWEEAMLENNSYYDIDIIEKHNAPIRKKIEQLIVEQSKASSWLGKWYWQIKIDRERGKLNHYGK
jgi:hypothetical protein